MPSNALDHITVRGFKSIASIENLEIKPINLLIGANGSGKSNFIGVFAFLHAIREGRLREYVAVAGGADKLLHFGSKTTLQLELEISFRDGINKYELGLIRTADDALFPAAEVVYFRDEKNYSPIREVPTPREGLEAGISDPNPSGITRYVQDWLDTWRLYHVHDTSSTSPMRRTSKVDDNRYLRPDGSNLAAFLFLLKERYPNSYILIRNAIRRVAPFFDDFQLAPLQRNPTDIRLEWRHRGSEQYFDASSMSDGTLRFVALATLFLQPESFRPSVILVDEPELGLHPAAIEMLAALIRQASTKTQVIVSTQSSLLLDQFDPEDVLVANRVEGGTQISRLEPAALAGWLDEYSLGQLWEKNEFGGRPLRD